MRFATAIGLLTASTTAANLNSNMNSNSNTDVLRIKNKRGTIKKNPTQRQDQIQVLLQGPNSPNTGSNKGIGFGGGVFQNRRREQITSSSSSALLLKNVGVKVVAEPRTSTGSDSVTSTGRGMECDPTSEDADVGVLSCGIGQYCSDSATSTLGGICEEDQQEDMQSQRRQLFHLQGYCNASYPMYRDDLECNCDAFDLESGTGTIDCVYESYCLGDEYPTQACNGTCGVVTISYDLENNEETAYTFCYDLLTPYQQNICISYEVNSTDCSILVGDTMCNACQVFEEESYEGCYDSPYTNSTICYSSSQRCRIFDCSNTEVGTTGSDCGDYILSPIEECIDSIEDLEEPLNPPCNICGLGGGSITLPDGNVSIPTQPDRTCAELQAAGDAGALGSIECAVLSGFTEDPCGCLFVCSICGEGNVVTDPDGIITIPFQPNRTCGQVQAVAEAGEIEPIGCLAIELFTREPCKCEPETQTATTAPSSMMEVTEPTLAPVDVPVEDPTGAPVVVDETGAPTAAPTPSGAVSTALSGVWICVASMMMVTAFVYN